MNLKQTIHSATSKFYKEETPQIMQTIFIINHPRTRLIKENIKRVKKRRKLEKSGISLNYLAT